MLQPPRRVDELIGPIVAIDSALPGTPAQEIANYIARHHIGALPVMDGVRLIGIVSERDLVTRVMARQRDPLTVTAAEIMTHDPVTVSSDCLLEDALKLMLDRKIRHLPVVDDGSLRAVLALRDFPAHIMLSLPDYS